MPCLVPRYASNASIQPSGKSAGMAFSDCAVTEDPAAGMEQGGRTPPCSPLGTHAAHDEAAVDARIALEIVWDRAGGDVF